MATTTPSRLFIGAMSGTSADGVDVAVVALSGGWPAPKAAVLHHLALAMPDGLASLIHEARFGGKVSLADFCRLGQDLTLLYARAVSELLAATGLSRADVVAIGAHGQTLYHAPPHTLQWLDPSLLADRTGIRVVHDFRRADCAAGGLGAPLVPLADRVMFGSTSDRLVVNLGGIANVTWLFADGRWAGWDTGPANCLSDRLMQLAGRGAFDAGGTRALQGTVCSPVLDRFLASGYFHAPAPKSTDGPAMWAAFSSAGGTDLPLEDALASAAACVAGALVTSVEREAVRLGSAVPAEWAIGGGGLLNARAMSEIAGRLPVGVRLAAMDGWGCPPIAREAAAFAILAAASIDCFAGNIPSVTGATRSVVLGSITCGHGE